TRWITVVLETVAQAERELVGHLHGERQGIGHQRIERARLHGELVAERGRGGEWLRIVDAGGSGGARSARQRNTPGHSAGRGILEDVLGTQHPITRSELHAQLRGLGVEDAVARASGDAALILEATELIVVIAQTTESEHAGREVIVALPQRLP